MSFQQHMLRHCPQHARLALLVTAAQRTRELKYVLLMTLLDTFIALTQVSCFQLILVEIFLEAILRYLLCAQDLSLCAMILCLLSS